MNYNMQISKDLLSAVQKLSSAVNFIIENGVTINNPTNFQDILEPFNEEYFENWQSGDSISAGVLFVGGFKTSAFRHKEHCCWRAHLQRGNIRITSLRKEHSIVLLFLKVDNTL